MKINRESQTWQQAPFIVKICLLGIKTKKSVKQFYYSTLFLGIVPPIGGLVALLLSETLLAILLFIFTLFLGAALSYKVGLNWLEENPESLKN